MDETRSFSVAQGNPRPTRPNNSAAVRRPAGTTAAHTLGTAAAGQVKTGGDGAKKTQATSQMPRNPQTAQAPSGAQKPAQQRVAQQRVAQQRPTQRPVANSSANPTARPVQPGQAQERPVPARNVVNPCAAELKTPANHGPSSENAQSTKAISEDMRQEMVRAKNARAAANDPRVKEKFVDDSYRGNGEGGNTIISILKAVVYIVFVCVVSVFLSVAIIKVGNDVFAFVKSDQAVEIVLTENPTLDELAEVLYENGVIEYPEVFKLYAVVKKDNQKYVAGTYTVNPMMNYEFLLAEFKEKIDYGTVRITIPEGYTTDEIIDLFVSQGIGTREGFVDVIQNGEFDYWFIDELEENGISEDRIYRLDGYLFPDTYDFYKSSSEKTVINKLLKRFNQMFTSEYKLQCELMGYTVDEIVTLASIIEKEAANSSEFFKVSSVFHNRLNNPWSFPNLESDATVVYAIHHETGERNVDLNYDTPYNTYKYKGLTPGPIANPSASAMLAALLPQESNYYFFYAHGGKTYFSETKAQHEAYIEQFRNQSSNQPVVDIPED